jgi:predicted MFS family arabinose efflux permease
MRPGERVGAWLMSDPRRDSPPLSSTRTWLAVTSIAFGTFVLVTSEFLPVGLLTKIAADLRASDGAVGQMVTIPGLVAAVAAPALVVGAGRLDRRFILWALSLLLVVSNLVVALAPNLFVLLAGRILLGIAVGGFWAISAAIPPRLVPLAHVGRATAVIFAGISVGTVLGVPTGALISDTFGWRAAFFATAAFGIPIFLAQLVFLVPLPPSRAIALRHLPELLRIPRARLGLIATVLVVTGQFGAYTYLGAFLEQVAAIPLRLISALLLAYGLAGIAGNFLGGIAAHRDVRLALTGIALMLGGSIVLLPVFGTSQISAVALTIIWGLAFGAMPISLQTWMFKAAPDVMEGGGALFISTMQIALATGSLLGGAVVDHFGLALDMACAGIAALFAAAVVWRFGHESYGSLRGRGEAQSRSV